MHLLCNHKKNADKRNLAREEAVYLYLHAKSDEIAYLIVLRAKHTHLIWCSPKSLEHGKLVTNLICYPESNA